jgi:hypothetical protein
MHGDQYFNEIKTNMQLCNVKDKTPNPMGPRGAGNLKFTIYAPLSKRCIISKLKRIGAVVIKKKLKMLQC